MPAALFCDRRTAMLLAMPEAGKLFPCQSAVTGAAARYSGENEVDLRILDSWCWCAPISALRLR